MAPGILHFSLGLLRMSDLNDTQQLLGHEVINIQIHIVTFMKLLFSNPAVRATDISATALKPAHGTLPWVVKRAFGLPASVMRFF